jgi:GNAT superfamily N-acetyltransferase
MSELSFIEPRSASEMEAFRRLNWEYRDVLLALPPPHNAAVLAAYPEEKYAQILDAAETENRPPRGMMRLLTGDDGPLGCGTIQTIGDGDAEIKRVFIVPSAQGQGAGRRLMAQLVEDCRSLGFRRILMDTGVFLTKAVALYDSMGFIRRGPYADLPEDAIALRVFFEMPLD